MSRLAVLGIGATSSLGGSWADTWAGLLAGRRSVCDPRAILSHAHMSKSVSAVTELDRRLVDEEFVVGAASRLALAACRDALQGLELRDPIAVFGGSTHGESDILFDLARRDSAGAPGLSPVQWRGLMEDSVASRILALAGGGVWVYSSCTSSLHALVLAALELLDDASPAEHALVVGVDALSVLGTEGFARIGAATPSNCTPFHVGRNGTLVGEGAAALVLNRGGADPPGAICNLAGFGMSCEAAHPTRPNECGDGLETAIRQALIQAGVAPGEITAIVLHGTGTPHNDAAEAKAVERVFGTRALPATSVKGAIGHTMGAAGLFNALVGIQSCVDGLLPPTWSDGSATIDTIDLVVGEPRKLPPHRMVLVNCSGFGGNCVAAVFASPVVLTAARPLPIIIP